MSCTELGLEDVPTFRIGFVAPYAAIETMGAPAGMPNITDAPVPIPIDAYDMFVTGEIPELVLMRLMLLIVLAYI